MPECLNKRVLSGGDIELGFHLLHHVFHLRGYEQLSGTIICLVVRGRTLRWAMRKWIFCSALAFGNDDLYEATHSPFPFGHCDLFHLAMMKQSQRFFNLTTVASLIDYEEAKLESLQFGCSDLFDSAMWKPSQKAFDSAMVKSSRRIFDLAAATSSILLQQPF